MILCTHKLYVISPLNNLTCANDFNIRNQSFTSISTMQSTYWTESFSNSWILQCNMNIMWLGTFTRKNQLRQCLWWMVLESQFELPLFTITLKQFLGIYFVCMSCQNQVVREWEMRHFLTPLEMVKCGGYTENISGSWSGSPQKFILFQTTTIIFFKHWHKKFNRNQPTFDVKDKQIWFDAVTKFWEYFLTLWKSVLMSGSLCVFSYI